MSTISKPDGQLTFASHEELEQWLAESAPRDSLEAVARRVYATLYALNPSSKYGGGPSKQYPSDAYRALRHRWPSEFSDDAILDSIDNLQAEYDAAEKAEAEAEAVRRAERDKILATEAGKREAARRRQAAEEERRKRIAEHHTAQVKKLAKATGLSTRQAQRMIREGVKEPRRAQQMADTLGGDACYFLRAKAKPGREPDLAAHMMRARVYDTTFRDFAEDDVELAGAAADALYRMARPGDHYANLEELMTTARERGVDADAALILWHHYTLWRMRVVYDKAEEQVRDKLERQFDFG